MKKFVTAKFLTAIACAALLAIGPVVIDNAGPRVNRDWCCG